MAVGPLDSTSWERKDGRKVCTPTVGYAVCLGYASAPVSVYVHAPLSFYINVRTYQANVQV